ncbi:MAG: hypothetical protein ACK58P_03410, partial [Betaproteobacteria bacterium]
PRVSIGPAAVEPRPVACAGASARLQIEMEAGRSAGGGDGRGDVTRLKAVLQSYRARHGAGTGNGTGNGKGNGNGNGNGNGHGGAGCRVVLGYRNAQACAQIALPEEWRVRPEDALLADLLVQPRVQRAAFEYP